MTRDDICVGVISGAHGVRGAVRIKAFTAEPRSVFAYGPVSDESGERRFDLRFQPGAGAARGGQVIARIDGVADRAAAEALKGTRLHVPRSALPQPDADEFYHADLIGLEVESVDGGRLGRVRSVDDYGAGDMLTVDGEDGREIMLPFTRSVVPEVDIAGGRIVADPPAGLLDADAEEHAEEHAEADDAR